MKPSMDSEAIEEIAAHWLFRQLENTWTAADQAELEVWLEERLAHRFAYIRLYRAWSGAAKLKALGAGIPPGVIPPKGSWGDVSFPLGADVRGLDANRSPAKLSSGNPAPARSVRRRLFAFAAVAVLGIAAGIFTYTSGYLEGDRYATEVGGRDTVPLSDGSQVTLNTDSVIRVSLANTERRIDLKRGEAYFEVAPDPTRPFVVNAGRKRVIAVGTKFSVRRQADDIRVIVTEGKVRVEDVSNPLHRVGNAPDAALSATADHAGGTAHEVFVTAGGIAQTADAQVLVHKDAPEEAANLLSWRSGYVFFRDTPLADAVAEFNRYNTRKIYIEDPAIAAVQIGGTFRADNTDAFLWLLKSAFHIDIEASGDQVILKKR